MTIDYNSMISFMYLLKLIKLLKFIINQLDILKLPFHNIINVNYIF